MNIALNLSQKDEQLLLKISKEREKSVSNIVSEFCQKALRKMDKAMDEVPAHKVFGKDWDKKEVNKKLRDELIDENAQEWE